MNLLKNILKKIADFIADPAKRKVLHINRPTFDLLQKRNLFTQFTNLEQLTLIFDPNYQHSLPEEIGQIQTLKKLYILNYNFTAFPKWVFNLHNLEDLTIRGNHIQVIPKGIGQLTKLKQLRIENTDLESLPEDIHQLKNLTSLSLIDSFKLKGITAAELPPNLKRLTLIPSGIPTEMKDKISRQRPELRVK